MVPALEQVAEKLDLSPEELWRESLLAYLAREEHLAEMDIRDLRDRYRVASAEELSARIRAGEIHSHPAWEELIEWENLNAHLQRLKNLKSSLN